MTLDSSTRNSNVSSSGSQEAVAIESEPYIPASKALPEITLKAVLLGVILAALLGASNAYLGLKIGQTVSACIPAAVISMAVLRLFKNSNILENNIVQTAASAGEVVAAAVIFTLPALLIVGYWDHFNYIETTSIAVIGGILGIFFSIPLRRALIVDLALPFPEGVATAEVLKAGEEGGEGAKNLLKGGVLAAIAQFGQSGLQLFGESLQAWFKVSNVVFGFGTGLSTVTIGAGYIVGLRIGLSLLVGAIITYGIGIPIYSAIHGVPDAPTSLDAAMMIKSKLKYMGVGAMVVSGLWALVRLMKPIKSAVLCSFETMRKARLGQVEEVLRTERDIPMTYVLIGSALLAIPVFIILSHIIGSNGFEISTGVYWITVISSLIFALFVGFLCASISGYMSGLVGSSSNPLSGTIITAVLGVAFILLLTLGCDIDFAVNKSAAMSATATVIIISAVVACAAAISGDNLQDLKSGQIVGATPWKQQFVLIIGVVAGAAVISPVLEVLYQAYGMGGIFPREGMDPTKGLAAPQAVLVATVAKGVFDYDLPYDMLLIGGLIAVATIMMDRYLKNQGKGYSLPPLAVALGLYLPVTVSMAFVLGGVLNSIVEKTLRRKEAAKSEGAETETRALSARRRGVLFASGMIAGDALMGIVLAIPFATLQSTSVFRMVPDFLEPFTTLIGVVVVGGISYVLYQTATCLKAHK